MRFNGTMVIVLLLEVYSVSVPITKNMLIKLTVSLGSLNANLCFSIHFPLSFQHSHIHLYSQSRRIKTEWELEKTEAPQQGTATVHPS